MNLHDTDEDKPSHIKDCGNCAKYTKNNFIFVYYVSLQD